MPSLDHTHSFVRYKKTERTTWFKCNDPKCTAVFDKELITGKISLCPICKQTEFTLTKEDLKRREPRCINCSDTKEARQYRRAKTIAAAALINLNMEEQGTE